MLTRKRVIDILAEKIAKGFFGDRRYYFVDVLPNCAGEGTPNQDKGSISRCFAEYLYDRFASAQLLKDYKIDPEGEDAPKKHNLSSKEGVRLLQYFPQPETMNRKHFNAIAAAQRDVVVTQFNFFLSERADSLGFRKDAQVPTGIEIVKRRA